MYEIKININGMACSMCEAHMNDTFRNAFQVKKVSSSHKKEQTVILTEDDILDEKLKEIVEKTGYEFVSAEHCIYQKK
ncbi:MAG: heavy-metal-associated domain-containing protein [Clostridia bacterium]|nr:heavy-metal-associated domain-containing protein [Clostridia bacterium]